MKNFLLAFILGTLPFLATGKPIPAITDSLGNRIYNLNSAQTGFRHLCHSARLFQKQALHAAQ